MAVTETDTGWTCLHGLSGILSRKHFETAFEEDGLLTAAMGGETLCAQKRAPVRGA